MQIVYKGCVSMLLFNCVNVGLPFEFGGSSVVVWSSTEPVASFRGRPFFGLLASDESGLKCAIRQFVQWWHQLGGVNWRENGQNLTDIAFDGEWISIKSILWKTCLDQFGTGRDKASLGIKAQRPKRRILDRVFCPGCRC